MKAAQRHLRTNDHDLSSLRYQSDAEEEILNEATVAFQTTPEWLDG